MINEDVGLVKDLRIVVVGTAYVAPVCTRWKRVEVFADESRDFLDLLRACHQRVGDFRVVMLAHLVKIFRHDFPRVGWHIHDI